MLQVRSPISKTKHGAIRAVFIFFRNTPCESPNPSINRGTSAATRFHTLFLEAWGLDPCVARNIPQADCPQWPGGPACRSRTLHLSSFHLVSCSETLIAHIKESSAPPFYLPRLFPHRQLLLECSLDYNPETCGRLLALPVPLVLLVWPTVCPTLF